MQRASSPRHRTVSLLPCQRCSARAPIRFSGAKMDANPELDAAPRRKPGIAFNHAVLHLNGAANGIDDAPKLNENAVTRALDHTSVVRAVLGSIRSLRSARSLASVRSSSAPASLLYPATSAARMAASLRVSAITAPHHTPISTFGSRLDELLRLEDHCRQWDLSFGEVCLNHLSMAAIPLRRSKCRLFGSLKG